MSYSKLPLFQYPPTWGNNISISELLKPSKDLCPKCAKDAHLVHRVCRHCLQWYTTCGQCDHCLVPNCDQPRWSTELAVPPILTAIKHFINVGVTDIDTDLAFMDCVRKLDGLDPREGKGLLHVVAENPGSFQIMAPECSAPSCVPALAQVENGHILLQLLELGLNPDIPAKLHPSQAARHPCKQSGTPLHFAVHEARTECVRMLIDAGADIFVVDAMGLTPYMLAKQLLNTHAGKGGQKVPRWRMILHVLELAIRNKPSLAVLIRDGKWAAVRSLMRRGKVRLSMFCQIVEGRTAMDWLWDSVARAARAPGAAKMTPALVAPAKVLAEVKFRYGTTVLPVSAHGNPPTLQRLSLSFSGNNHHEQQQQQQSLKPVGHKQLLLRAESSLELNSTDIYSVPVRLPKENKTSTPISTDI